MQLLQNSVAVTSLPIGALCPCWGVATGAKHQLAGVLRYHGCPALVSVRHREEYAGATPCKQCCRMTLALWFGSSPIDRNVDALQPQPKVCLLLVAPVVTERGVCDVDGVAIQSGA